MADNGGSKSKAEVPRIRWYPAGRRGIPLMGIRDKLAPYVVDPDPLAWVKA